MGPPQQQSDLNATQAAQSWILANGGAAVALDPDHAARFGRAQGLFEIDFVAAGLLADHGLPAEAEQEFRIALQLTPESPEAVFRYINLLMSRTEWRMRCRSFENAHQSRTG